MNTSHLELFAWRFEQRVLFIATQGGAHDLVKDHPISDEMLAKLQGAFRELNDLAVLTSRSGVTGGHTERLEFAYRMRGIGELVSQHMLHEDIRSLLLRREFSEITISTNELSVPWELLPVADTFLALLCPITRRLQTPRLLREGPRVAFRHRLRVLLVVDPTGDLPATRDEARLIQEILAELPSRFTVTALFQEDCSREQVLKHMVDSDIFHYAGHAAFNPARPHESSLLLADGPLLASDLETQITGSAPMLVFLSACESAMFERSGGGESRQTMAGLAHPFITAGCAAFIGSSLPISDIQASEFATTVYRHWSHGDTLATSMWKARSAVAERFGLEDCTWGSFLFFGDGGLKVILNPDSEPVTSARIHDAIGTAISWLRSERVEAGVWCDRVYRKQAPNNAAEVILAFDSAQIPMTSEERAETLQCVLAAKSTGYSASPYEPEALGEFASCAAYVLQALTILERDADPSELEVINTAIADAVATLLNLQTPLGGWSWGRNADGVACYLLFTTEVLDALTALPDPSDATRAGIERAYSYVKESQHRDGGWSYADNIENSDLSSTCYALCCLLDGGEPPTSPTIMSGLTFLRERLNLSELDQSQFFLDHRIEVPKSPRNSWPHFEDYSGMAGLCELILLLPEAETVLCTSGLRDNLIRRVLNAQEVGRGWPTIYSTIYATAYYVSVLALAVEVIEEEERNIKN